MAHSEVQDFFQGHGESQRKSGSGPEQPKPDRSQRKEAACEESVPASCGCMTAVVIFFAQKWTNRVRYIIQITADQCHERFLLLAPCVPRMPAFASSDDTLCILLIIFKGMTIGRDTANP